MTIVRVVLPVFTVLSLTGLVVAFPIPHFESSEYLLQANDLPTQTHELVGFISKRCSKEPTPAEVAAAIQGLGAEEYRDREAAVRALVSGGPFVIDAVRSALRDGNPERAVRAEEVLSLIARDWNASSLSTFRAAVHLLARRRPDGVLPVFHRVLPLFTEDEVLDDVWAAVDAITVRTGRVDPLWERAAADAAPERRAMAAYLLGRRGTPRQRVLATTILADGAEEVRLRAAQGLLGAGDFTGVPTLIDLLDARSRAVAWQAEELLTWVAGDETPPTCLGFSFSDLWRQWWDRVGKAGGIDFIALSAEPRRPTLFMTTGSVPASPCTFFGCDGRVRWRYQNDPALIKLPFANLVPVRVTAVMPSGHLLGVAVERNAQGFPSQCAFECDHTGRRLWSVQLGTDPSSSMRASGTCERWVGGITSFAGPRGVGVRTLAGRVMFAEHRPQPDRSDPRRLVIPTYFERADHFFARFVSENGAEVLDRGTGRVLGSIPTSIWEGGKLMLGANHLFLTTTGERLAEREPGGRIVWEALGLPSGLIDVGSVPVRQSGLTYGLDVIRHNPNPDEKTDYLQVKVLFSRLRLGFDDLPGKRVDVRASLPHRIRQLQHPDPVVRGRATDLLVHEMGEAAAPALPALVANYAVYLARRGEAETAWPYYDPFKAIQAVAGKDRVELARKFRTDGRPLVRAGALLLMSNATQCSPDFSSEERFAAAKAALSDPSPDVRRAALEVLRTDTQKQGEEFCRLLLPMLADTVRPTEGSILPATEAARGLACRNAVAPGVEHEIKPQTYERIIKGLCELVGHPNDELAEASLWSLGYVGAVSDRYAAAAVPALSRLLKDTDRPRLQLAGAWSMGALGSKGRPGVPYLMDTLRTDNSVKLRKTICNALMEIGPAASEAVPGLVDLIQTTPLWTEKATYLMVLEEIGPSAKQALQALRKLRESEAAAGNNKNVERIESVMEKIEK